jgi:sulfatase-modifying factor enzyme 1
VCRRVEASAVPEVLRRLNFIFFDESDRFDDSANKLAEALQTDIVWIRDHTKFGEAARAWVAAGRPTGLLLCTPALEMAEYWMASHPPSAPDPTEEIKSFVAHSRQVEVAAGRRSRILNAALYTLLVGIILGLVGWINQDYLKQQINWYWIMRPYRVANMDPYVLKADVERALKPLASFRECAKDCPEMIVIPAGSFMMGSPASEPGHNASEAPQHMVTIARPFAVSKFDVTFADFNAGSHVPYESLVEVRAAYMPDAVRAVSGHPPN